jgi:hypothetical protein
VFEILFDCNFYDSNYKVITRFETFSMIHLYKNKHEIIIIAK